MPENIKIGRYLNVTLVHRGLTYQLDYYYFGLAVDQRDYTLLTEADLQRCTKGSVNMSSKNPVVPPSSSNVRREFILPELK
jgi:hypothetical protein